MTVAMVRQQGMLPLMMAWMLKMRAGQLLHARRTSKQRYWPLSLCLRLLFVIMCVLDCLPCALVWVNSF
jgi:hypothetical protein